MKKFSQCFVVFLLFISLVLSSKTSARVLLPKVGQGIQELKVKDTANNENISKLMGLDEKEVCGDKQGEECTAERKLLAEAHLDYIYTQKLDNP